jgi:adenine-specific DNA-methyltransferase
MKYRELYSEKTNPVGYEDSKYDQVEIKDGTRRSLTKEEKTGAVSLPGNSKIFRHDTIMSSGSSGTEKRFFEYQGESFDCGPNNHWKASVPEGMNRLGQAKRLAITGKGKLAYIRYFNDFPLIRSNNIWTNIGGTVQSRSDSKVYVVQTGTAIIERCLLMCTDPGDLVIDPTCGSGTTAFVAEQWGRRWITTDTSRIALNIAKTRLMTANFPYYHLYSDVNVERVEKNGKIKKNVTPKPANEQTGESTRGDIRQGFVYEEVPHITLKSLANNEPADTETLYDKPDTDKKRLRVSGPFTVETLQNFACLWCVIILTRRNFHYFFN